MIDAKFSDQEIKCNRKSKLNYFNKESPSLTISIKKFKTMVLTLEKWSDYKIGLNSPKSSTYVMNGPKNLKTTIIYHMTQLSTRRNFLLITLIPKLLFIPFYQTK